MSAKHLFFCATRKLGVRVLGSRPRGSWLRCSDAEVEVLQPRAHICWLAGASAGCEERVGMQTECRIIRSMPLHLMHVALQALPQAQGG